MQINIQTTGKIGVRLRLYLDESITAATIASTKETIEVNANKNKETFLLISPVCE